MWPGLLISMVSLRSVLFPISPSVAEPTTKSSKQEFNTKKAYSLPQKRHINVPQKKNVI